MKDIEYSYATEWDDNADTLYIPAATEDEVIDILNAVPDLDKTRDPDKLKWLEVTATASRYNIFGDVLKVVSAEDWDNKVSHNEVNIEGYTPHGKVAEGKEIKGALAMMSLMTHLGTGSYFQIPLWHSGFWITVRPPSESAVVDLYRAIYTDKVTLGRVTHGTLYSNTQVVTLDRVTAFILDHVHSTTLNVEIGLLDKYIKVPDIMVMAWGMLCAEHPSGVQYRRGCLDDKCAAVVEEMLDLKKLLWVDRKAYTSAQKEHMLLKKPGQHNPAQIKDYQQTLEGAHKCVFTLKATSGSEIDITLGTPTVREYIKSGREWIESIESLTADAFEQDNTEGRNKLIKRHAQATSMRQYSQWVQQITIGSNVVVDKTTLEDMMNTMGQDTLIRTGYMDAVFEYIKTHTSAMVGVPTYECPSCHVTQQDEHNEDTVFANIIPLDIITIFFYLEELKMTGIDRR